MLYHVTGLCPPTDIRLGRAGFCIKLWPEWRDEVTRWNKTQAEINTAVQNLGRAWLDGCGYDAIFDPDNCGHRKDTNKPPGPKARPSYEPNIALRVTWGEWGPEHITVPGNACGLDIGMGIGAPIGGRVLLPHNVDSVIQAHLLLVVFMWFADCLVMEKEAREWKAREKNA